MHIGFLTPEYVTDEAFDGGLAAYVKKTAAALAGRGHRVTVFWLSDRSRTWSDGNVTVIEISRCLENRIFSRIPVLGGLAFSINAVRERQNLAHRVMEEHRNHPLDILQQSNYLACGNALLHNNHIPVVCRASSNTALFQQVSRYPRTLRNAFIRWLDDRQMKESDAVFSPSQLVAGTFFRATGRPVPVIRTPLAVPADPVDTSLYDSRLQGLRYLLFFGTLNRIKGVDLIASAIPRIAARYPDISFVFIGRDNGMDRYQKTRDLIGERSGRFFSRVVILDSIPKSLLNPVIARAAGVLVPSRLDNYPNAVLEAMVSGIPVIGTRGSSLDEMIEEGKTGFLAENDNAESLCAAIERLLDLAMEDYVVMKNAARDQAREMLREDRIGQLEAFYTAAITAFRKNHCLS